MKAATEERVRHARTQIRKGSLVFIRLASSGREYRVFALGTSQHNIEAILSEDESVWMVIDPDELVGVRVVENNDG